MRDDKLSTTVTEEEKQAFRELSAKDGMTMSEKLRELVYDELERRGGTTSRGSEGNPKTRAVADA